MLFRHDGSFLAAKTNYGGHEVGALFLRCAPDVLEQVLPLLLVPAIGSLILRNSKQSPVKQLVERDVLWLNIDHIIILLSLLLAFWGTMPDL
jgi:hypothetical protein